MCWVLSIVSLLHTLVRLGGSSRYFADNLQEEEFNLFIFS